MAEQFQTSFIPKKSFDVAGEIKSKPGGNILFTASVILLVLAVLSAGGVFGYKKFLESSIENKREALQRARAAFEPELIRELSHLDTKIATAEGLLEKHIAISGIFDLLQDVTLETVQFTNFGFSIEPEGIRLSMSGVARSFSSVALQSDEFVKNRFISQPVFSNLALNQRGDVTFAASALIDPAAVSYSGRVESGATASFDVAPDVAGAADNVATEESQPSTDL